MNEYQYIVVSNNDPANSIGQEVLEWLGQGYDIQSAVPTQGAVHYILKIPDWSPKRGAQHKDSVPSNTDDAPVKPIDDVDDKPINLDDIPF